jgi:hypothetical protein
MKYIIVELANHWGVPGPPQPPPPPPSASAYIQLARLHGHMSWGSSVGLIGPGPIGFRLWPNQPSRTAHDTISQTSSLYDSQKKKHPVCMDTVDKCYLMECVSIFIHQTIGHWEKIWDKSFSTFIRSDKQRCLFISLRRSLGRFVSRPSSSTPLVSCHLYCSWRIIRSFRFSGSSLCAIHCSVSRLFTLISSIRTEADCK